MPSPPPTLFLLGAQVGAIAHFYRLASTRDGTATAALALAMLATCSTIGRLVGGGLLLKVPARTFALVLMAMQACGLAALALARRPRGDPGGHGAVRASPSAIR